MLKRYTSLFAFIIALIITGILFYLLPRLYMGSAGPFPADRIIEIPNGDPAFGGLFDQPRINDSLPYYQYKKIADSLERFQKARELDNKSIGSGKSVGPVGVWKIRKTWMNWWNNDSKNDPRIREMKDSLDMINKLLAGTGNKDSIDILKKEIDNILPRYDARQNELAQEKNEKEEQLYYIGLNGYTLDEDSRFFVQDETYNLAYVKWDSVIMKEYDSTRMGHYESKQIPVRYAPGEKRVLIPVSKKKYDFAGTALQIIFYLYLLFFAYFFVGLPIRILINISLGDAFHPKNISWLNLMAAGLTALALVKIFAPFVIRIYYRKTIPDDFQSPSFAGLVIDTVPLLLLAIVLFITGKAFQRGYHLQEEED